MKKILLFIIGIFAVMSLVSCGLDDHQDSANHIQINNNRFQETGEFYYIKEKKFEIIEDTKTKNLYLYCRYTGFECGSVSLTPFYDENGNIAKAIKQ